MSSRRYRTCQGQQIKAATGSDGRINVPALQRDAFYFDAALGDICPRVADGERIQLHQIVITPTRTHSKVLHLQLLQRGLQLQRSIASLQRVAGLQTHCAGRELYGQLLAKVVAKRAVLQTGDGQLAG